MAVTKKVSEVTFGGNAGNNPPNYSWTDYRNYPDLDTNLTYVRISVIAMHEGQRLNMEVTGLLQVVQGQLMSGPNDLVYLPCPPFCPE
jgi:hypothetical protein